MMKILHSLSLVLVCLTTTLVTQAQTPSISNFQTTGMVVYGYTAASSGAASEITIQLAIDSSGMISGNGTIRSYAAKADFSQESTFTISAGSKLSLPISSTTPLVSSEDGVTTTLVVHSIDCVIRTSNKMTLKGRLKYWHNQSNESGVVTDDSVLVLSLAAMKKTEVGILSGSSIVVIPL
jgi:hypothetical protein